jgi:hypothetical protein
MPTENPLIEIARQSHGRAPRPCGAPAITAHLGYWCSLPPSQGEGAQAHIDSARTVLTGAFARINAAIFRFQDLLGIPKDFQKSFVDSDGREIPEHFVPIEFEFGGLVGKAIFSRNTEAVLGTFMIDLSKPPIDELYPLRAAWVGDAADRLRAIFAELQKAMPGDETALRPNADYLYSEFWEQFFRYIEIEKTLADTGYRWERFADVRGVVITVGDEGKIHRVQDLQPSHDFLNRVPMFDDDEAAEALHRAWPFIRASHAEAADAEFVMNRLIRRRAIFVSAFGDLGVGIARKNSPPPRVGTGVVRFLVMANGLGATRLRPGSEVQVPFNRWQIGRLIFRLNDLAVMRALALRDLELIKRAGRYARPLGRRLDELFAKITMGGEVTRRDINDLYKALNNLGAETAGGLSYRINRARLMGQGYRRTLADMEAERIEGCQTYDEFMRRRVYHEFDSIDRIGIRIERLTARAASLLSLVDTNNDLQTTRRIAGLTEKVADSQTVMADSQKAIADSERRIEHLQGTAEWLVGLGGCYYSGNILFHGVKAIPALSRWWPGAAAIRQSFRQEAIVTAVEFACYLATGLIILALIVRRRLKFRKEFAR